MSCAYVPVFTIRLDLALCIICIGFVCLGRSLWNCVWPYRVLSCLLSVLSCLVDVRNTKLCLGTQSCGIRVRRRTHHVSHGSRVPWKHQLLRSGFVELVPVVVNLFQNKCSSLCSREKVVCWRFVFNDVCCLRVTVLAL